MNEWQRRFFEAAMSGERVGFHFGRGSGKRIIEEAVLRDHLMDGGHIHRVKANNDTVCEGGDPDCPLWGIQLIEALETWT